MASSEFNPFEDRLSRDIRNSLSEAFSKAIETGDSHSLNLLVKHYLSQKMDPCYQQYISDRNTKYQKAKTAIDNTITHPIGRAVTLWNLQLFFEVHEVLEHAWYNATGHYRGTLQALIRSAGVYIKIEYGFDDSASRIASKAIPVLEENIGLLQSFFSPTQLIDALKNIDTDKIPPILSKNEQ